MFLDTDVSGYLDEFWADGIPASSVKMREFEPLAKRDGDPQTAKPYRDLVIQPYTPSYRHHLMAEKQRIVYPHQHHYHLSRLDKEFERDLFSTLTKRIGHGGDVIEYGSAFEWCMRHPTDLVICRRQEFGGHEIDFVHAVFPSGWSAPEAYRKPFSYFHSDVTTAGRRNVLPIGAPGVKFVDHFINSGKTYERVGAFSFDNQYILCKTPDKLEPWGPSLSNLMVRFERQVIVSLPEFDAFAFFIQTNHVDVREKPDLITHAIENAHEDCYAREFLGTHKESVLSYLRLYL